MDGSHAVEFLRTHSTDIAIGAFAVCAVVGPTAWIIIAGLLAGGNLALRLTRGEFMTISERLS